MHCGDTVGYVGSGLVLAAFAMKDIVRLRLVAICSNLVFLAYGVSLGLTPIWVLHAILLPMNVWRLAEVLGLFQYTLPTQRMLKASGGNARAAAARYEPTRRTLV